MAQIVASLLRRSFNGNGNAVRNFVPVPKPGGIYAKKTFNLVFDNEGRYLVMHHKGAANYYKMNFGFLALFAGATLYNYKANSQVFFGEGWFGKAYLGITVYSIFALWLFSNKHIRCIWLLKGGKEVAIETYTNFGLTYNRPRRLPVACLEGNRLFLTKSINLYQLEYSYKSTFANLTKRRSYFYRPEHIED